MALGVLLCNGCGRCCEYENHCRERSRLANRPCPDPPPGVPFCTWYPDRKEAKQDGHYCKDCFPE